MVCTRLSTLGIHGTVLSQIESFVTSRTQTVVVNVSVKQFTAKTKGVKNFCDSV